MVEAKIDKFLSRSYWKFPAKILAALITLIKIKGRILFQKGSKELKKFLHYN